MRHALFLALLVGVAGADGDEVFVAGSQASRLKLLEAIDAASLSGRPVLVVSADWS